MRTAAVTLLSAFGLAICLAPAIASPIAPAPASAKTAAIEEVAGGCGLGLHRHHGYCVRNHYYRPYAYRQRYYRYYAPYPYYGGGYERWNRPSPGDHVANWLNSQEARRGYWGY